MRHLRQTGIHWLSGVLLVLGGYVMGSSAGLPLTAEAEVREVTPPEAFKSGGARSEVVLKEIAATLQRMDARMVTIEKAAGVVLALDRKEVSGP
jgi:hypothetical protein